ncbi:unnamed protein product, partial [Aureobasidium mustum]
MSGDSGPGPNAGIASPGSSSSTTTLTSKSTEAASAVTATSVSSWSPGEAASAVTTTSVSSWSSDTASVSKSSEAASAVTASQTPLGKPIPTSSPPASSTLAGTSSNTSAGNGTSGLHAPNQHSTINAGTIAGAAVGAAVGAAILAFIVTYLLMRSRLAVKKKTNATDIDTGLIRPSLSEAMVRYRYKMTIIKQALANMIFSNITIEDESPGSLLPRDVAELQKSLQTATRDRSRPATSQALAYTRFLISYLRPAPYEDQALLAQRDRTIKAMATTFCVALEPWSSQGTTSDARCSNLIEILRGAAAGGILLFSQRATFKFDWDLKDRRPVNNIVVLPGLLKITDDKARPLDKILVCKPQVIAELR